MIVVGQQLGAGEIERAKDYDLKMVFMNFIMCFMIHCKATTSFIFREK